MGTEEWRQHYFRLFHKPGITLEPPASRPPPPVPDPTCPLTCAVSVQEVEAACKKVGTAKAVGADGVPSEFITHTRIGDQHASLLHTTLASLFTSIVRLGHMPTSWKSKLISPLFKKGVRTDPNNYRPISVATSIYRIFAAVFATRLTQFVADHPGHLAPSQLAFQKKLSTNHAHFILQTCIDNALHHRKRLAIVHLDISKAYDTVLRDKLWEVLEAQSIPVQFIRLMQELYRDCPFHVKVNGEISDAFSTNIGVQQGCPISPWTYIEYMSDPHKRIKSLCTEYGIQLYDLHTSACTHVGWADDIIGTVEQSAIRQFVDIVQQVLDPLNQHLNVGKTKVLPIQYRPYNGTTLDGFEVVSSMKLLGLLYNHRGCMADNVMSRRDTAHTKSIMHSGRLKALGCMHDPSIARTMLETDVRSTVLFGAAIWGHFHIQRRDPMTHPMQKAYSTIARQSMGLPHGTAHWTVALLFGLMPIQHWILRDFCRFWNSLLLLKQTHSLLNLAVQQQVHMLQHNRKCLLGRWKTVLNKVLPTHPFHHAVSNMQPIDEPSLLAAIMTY